MSKKRLKVLFFLLILVISGFVVLRVNWTMVWYGLAYEESTVLQTHNAGTDKETHRLNVWLTRKHDLIPGPYRILLQYDESGNIVIVVVRLGNPSGNPCAVATVRFGSRSFANGRATAET